MDAVAFSGEVDFRLAAENASNAIKLERFPIAIEREPLQRNPSPLPRRLLSLVAEKPEEIRRIDEDLCRLGEARRAAELAPHRRGLGEVAGQDVVPDLVPFGRRQCAP